MPFVQCDRGLEFGLFRVAHLQQVGLDAHIAEHRHPGPGGHADTTPGDMAFEGSHVGAHELGGKEKREPFLDAQTLQRVVAVRCPDTIRVREHAVVGTGAARGTAFDFDTGIGGPHSFQQLVEGQCLIVGHSPPVATARLVQIPVHVPFQVGDRILREQRVDALEQVVLNFPAGQVQHQLVPRH